MSDEGGTVFPLPSCEAADLMNVTDPFVKMLYRVAQHACPRTSDPGIKVALKSLMTTIAEKKPCRSHFPDFNHSMLRDWYHALLACDTIVELGALSQLGPAQAFLEDVLDVSSATADTEE
jgi:hypothetical protein